jgi:hypothetical protein
MLKRIFSFSNFTLLVALTLSTIAAWYSIIGLTTIFAGAVVPVIIMGSALELAKITTTVWLRKYWHRAGLLIKLYLVPAVMAIALITSMGIFGFLSKAHMDQGVTSGDIQSRIAIYDEKIKTEKENIEANRKALKQMDEGVDQVLGRSTTETGAEKAVAMRKSQQKERTRLQNEILQSQKSIAGLNDERAPIAAEVRKVEAEVGPIKYIAALLYGDNPDQNILERAVRWVIILLVIVFDPLALMLVLAANQSKDWDNEDEPAYEPDDGPINEEVLEALRERAKEELPTGELISKEELIPEEKIAEKEFDIKDHPYLFTPAGSHTPPGIEPVPIQVYKSEPSDSTLEPCYKCGTPLIDAPGIGPFCPNKECDVFDSPYLREETEEIKITYIPPDPIVVDDPNFEGIKVDGEWVQTGPDFGIKPKTENVESNTKSYEELEGGYVTYDGKHMHKDVLLSMRPDILKLVADSGRASDTGFGTSFPALAKKGDTFVRVDMLPNRVYKFDGTRWIQVNKDQTTSYVYDQEYIKYLVEKIDKGEYDIELLSEIEKQQIEEYLTKNS